MIRDMTNAQISNIDKVEIDCKKYMIQKDLLMRLSFLDVMIWQ